MLTESHYRAVLNFFYFMLLDEQLALSAAHRCVRTLRSDAKKSTLPLESLLIARCVRLYRKYARHKVRDAFLPPRSDWSVPQQDFFAAWKDLLRRINEDCAVVLIWHEILGYDLATLAQALGLSEGTIRFRVGRGVEIFAESPLIRTLVRP